MHQWHIIEELLNQVCTQAEENRINKLTKIQVELGEDSHVTEASSLSRIISIKLCWNEVNLSSPQTTGRQVWYRFARAMCHRVNVAH